MTSRDRIGDYCVLIQSLKEILKPVNYLVLKLYHGYNESRYEPQDIDIFIGKNLRRVLCVLKSIRVAFPESKAIRRKHLSLSINIFIYEYSLDVDLYLEAIFSPIFILDEIPKNIKITTIPWCRGIEVSSLDTSFNAFYILIHALRHKRLYDYEVISLIKELNDFNKTDCKNFLLYVKESGLENVMALLLKLILYHSKSILKASVKQYSMFYRTVLKMYKILSIEKTSINSFVNNFIENIVKLTLRKASSRHIGLWLVFPFYVVRTFVLALKSLSRKSFNILLKIIFIYLFYEYVITLFNKLKILK
ncbi:MAG: hypothetical protein QXR17_08350 [Candidatus Bathyarchaeia archaeon]